MMNYPQQNNMNNRLAILLLITFIISSCSFNTFPIGDKTVPAQSQEEINIIAKGERLNQQKQYQKAIILFNKILDVNPDNVAAIYQLSKTHYLLEDFETSLEYAELGMNYNSDFRINFIYQVQSCLYKLKRNKDIETLYKEAINFPPSKSKNSFLEMMYVKLSQYYAKKLDYINAEKHIIKAIELNKYSPHAHFELTKIYIAEQRMFEALFASWFFLVNEPNSSRAKKLIKEMDPFVNPNKFITNDDTKSNTLVIDNSNQGEYSSIKLLWELNKESIKHKNKDLGKEELKQIEFINIIKLFKYLTNIFITSENSDQNDKSKHKFINTFHIPMLKSIKEKDFFEPMFYHAYSRSDYNGINSWLDNNANNYRINDFLNWYNQEVK